MQSMSWDPREPVSDCFCYTNAECSFTDGSKSRPVKIGDRWMCYKSVPEECKDEETNVDNMCEKKEPCTIPAFDSKANPIHIHKLNEVVTCRRPIGDLTHEGILNCNTLQETYADMTVHEDHELGPICLLKHRCVDIECAMAVSSTFEQNFVKQFEMPSSEFPVSSEFTAMLNTALRQLTTANDVCTIPPTQSTSTTDEGLEVTKTSYTVHNFAANIWEEPENCCKRKEFEDAKRLPVLTCDDFSGDIAALCGEETKFRPRLDKANIAFPDVYFPWQLEDAPKTLMEKCCRPVASAALCLPNWGNAYMSRKDYTNLMLYTKMVETAAEEYAADVAPTMFDAGDDDIFTCTMNCIAIFTKLTQCSYELVDAGERHLPVLDYERQSKCRAFDAGTHTTIEARDADSVAFVDFKISDNMEHLCDKLYPSAATSIEALAANVKVLLKVFSEKGVDIETELPKLSTLVPTTFNERVFSIGCRDRCQGIMRRRTHTSSSVINGASRTFSLHQCTRQCGSYFDAIRASHRRSQPMTRSRRPQTSGSERA
eukprot:GILJ01000456.1.p1 GENE.GILJ01000456.1~~GILJ01000456.1.p1  ORF type:complete len:585 (-),score=74.49 GILJ01000456.1:159-1784(-)